MLRDLGVQHYLGAISTYKHFLKYKVFISNILRSEIQHLGGLNGDARLENDTFCTF